MVYRRPFIDSLFDSRSIQLVGSLLDKRMTQAAYWWQELWGIQTYRMWTSGKSGVRAIVFSHRAWSLLPDGRMFVTGDVPKDSTGAGQGRHRSQHSTRREQSMQNDSFERWFCCHEPEC